MLKAVIDIDNGNIQVAFSGNIKTLTLDITMLIHSIWNEANLSDHDKEFFKDFVQNELGKIAFMDEDELENEVETLKNKLIESEGMKKELTKLFNKLLEEE